MWNFPLFPDSASSLSPQVDGLLFILLAVATFFSLLIAGLILFFAIKYRAKSNADRRGALTSHLGLEILWTVIPVGIVLVMFVLGTKVFYEEKTMPANAVEMFVVGRQWMWKVQHPEGQREINAIHVPKGQPVQLTMISEDVIHDLSIPAFRVKQDVLPGMYTHLWFNATKTGQFHLFCSQYCGTLHSGMVGTVTVMEPKDYEAWLAGGGSAAPGGMMASGEQLFNRMACSTCHLNSGQGRGPSLVGLYGKTVALSNGKTVTADDAYLRESILKPEAKLVRGYSPIMPTFQNQLSEQSVLDLISYIKSLNSASTKK